MSKVTRSAISHFLAAIPYNEGNTTVMVERGEITLALHGNPIAKLVNGKLLVTTAKHPTNTTKERLNGIPCVNVYTKAKQLYLNGKPWDGEWVEI
jgi:hypothetical protein